MPERRHIQMIRITRSLSIDERDISCTFIRSGGPGGQNVNKVATAAQLRYTPSGRSPLPHDVQERLAAVAGSKMGADGEIVITARRFRSQERNREDARDRLVRLVRTAARRARPRTPTRPTAASRRRRLESKRHRSKTKQLRRQVESRDD